MADSYRVQIAKACAVMLDAAGLGVYVLNRAYTVLERGIGVNVDLPTTRDEAIILRNRPPIADGRANLIVPIQFRTRIVGTATDAVNFTDRLVDLFDQREGVPPGLHIARAELFSLVELTADTQGRQEHSITINFRGRRPIG